MSIPKERLKFLYTEKKMSAAQIGKTLNCSPNKVNYWINKYSIPKRSISEAIYVKANPKGDPFQYKKPRTGKAKVLYGLGVGLYWGEGTKRNRNSVRLGNTDPEMILCFIDFLDVIYNIRRSKLRYGLQIFSDINPIRASKFWAKRLRAHKRQFYKTVVTPARGQGNYRRKLKYGVLTVYFSNVKLQEHLCKEIEKFRHIK